MIILGGSGSAANLVSLVNGFAISAVGERVEGVAKRLCHEYYQKECLHEFDRRANLVPEILNDTLQRYIHTMRSAVCI